MKMILPACALALMCWLASDAKQWVRLIIAGSCKTMNQQLFFFLRQLVLVYSDRKLKNIAVSVPHIK